MTHLTNPRFKAWECVGCGRIEAPQPCLGICQDRAVELVHADDYERLQADNRQMRELILRLARTSPREGQWEAGYRALQSRALDLLDRLERQDAPN
ncbi:hypothetical protein [Wenzhouxiangella sediminis]|uniref:Uncharacterized protein n=1 Tax=Wenzhouxiangella sediminis TaxID=1792836 RepID=A0A3E1KD43_9GAMM|nr:hypothetical protein [Wenzhouxiangella sediminis]RFF33025.1 hypothetical protein DZC52_00235 [Wenzhouxiangella sediminis]